jgi:SAM-dependent methyltransferase
MLSRFKRYLQKRYAHPLVGQLDLDARETVAIHRRIIEDNPLLKKHYFFIYDFFKRAEEELAGFSQPSLEIGSGGGFLKEIIPSVITSDLVPGAGIDRIEDASRLSFPEGSLKAVYANGVLHHIPDPEKCLAQIDRVLVAGGVFVCNEPSSTPFGYFMNRHFHHEPADKTVRDWGWAKTADAGRLTGANMAMPYIIFKRDRRIFEEKFPRLRIRSIIYHDFMRYTLSGGLSFRPFVPNILYGAVNVMEGMVKPLQFILGHAMIVTIQKT